MRARISRGFVLIVVLAFSALCGCKQTTDTENIVSTPTGIAHLSIGAVEIEALVNVEDPETIADVLALLSEEQLSTLAGGEVLYVEDPSVTLEVAKTVGLDTSPPTVTEGGVLLSSIPMTWGQLKCCYGGNDQCCPKKQDPPNKKDR